jgi:hypothetical protein
MKIKLSSKPITTIGDLLEAMRPITEIILLRHAGQYEHSGAPSQYLRALRCREFLTAKPYSATREIHRVEAAWLGKFIHVHEAEDALASFIESEGIELPLEYGFTGEVKLPEDADPHEPSFPDRNA